MIIWKPDSGGFATAWEAVSGRIHIIMHRHINHSPTTWLVTCNALHVNEALTQTDLEKAQLEAVAVCRARLAALRKDMDGFRFR